MNNGQPLQTSTILNSSRPQPQSQSQRPLANAERQRRYRANKSARLAEEKENQASILHRSLSRREFERDLLICANWTSATLHFKKNFLDNEFGHPCNICDRLWFKRDLRPEKSSHSPILQREFGDTHKSFKLCENCFKTLNRGKIPSNSITNGFTYPSKPQGLPRLNPIMERMISPRIPFMAIRRLTRDGQYGIIGQVINMPIDVNTMIRSLPRQLDDDYVINVSFKRKLIHRSTYLQGTIKKNVLRAWLSYLVEQPLYRHYKITVDWNYLNQDNCTNDGADTNNLNSSPNYYVEDVDLVDKNADLVARQRTLLWNEESILEIAPAPGVRPLNFIFDQHSEELSFPQIYYGHARSFKLGIPVTPYMIASSETRRRDRRGVTPDHILYMAMKILRLRVVESIRGSFRCIQDTENISRRMIEDRRFLEESVERNFAFLKSIPNSVNYWHLRKNDLFAMMRQLGKPTAFLTLSANEINWPILLTILHRLRNPNSDICESNAMDYLDRSIRADLVNEDPVTCCLYFNKLVEVILTMLSSKKNYNPFGKYRVKDHFVRIEFQHRGSPHAHILLWLDNDPKEEPSEDMPLTLQLITDLCSVSRDDLPTEMYHNQVHRHTFTCTKRGEASCRFNIPYWPMERSRILVPLPENHTGIKDFKKRAAEIKRILEVKIYDSIGSFLIDNSLDNYTYENIIRSTLSRPTLVFRRNMNEIMTNTFHPWIGSILNSNMDLQYILDEYSCAAYVADYVNKSNRGMSNLHRELIKLQGQYPDLDQERLLKRLGQKIISTVELSAQEAAWYLLRIPMSRSSREVYFINTSMPCDRQKSYKTKAQMNRDNVGPDSTDVWTKSIIQYYEDRPPELDNICLADFAALYAKTKINQPNLENETSDCDDEREADLNVTMDAEGLEIERNSSRPRRQESYRRRVFSRVIRSCNYNSTDPRTVNNFKREMVLLYLPFRNEHCEIIDRARYLSTYDANIDKIAAKRKEYDSGIDLETIIEDFKYAQTLEACESEASASILRNNFLQSILDEGEEENFEDLHHATSSGTVSAVRVRSDLLSKEEYCDMMRTTNKRQKEFILEFIHRLTSANSPPIQVFFTGPAGSGKTYVLKLIMETLNRYSQSRSGKNAFIACASTGKAAVNLGGITVHSAFNICQSRQRKSLSQENLQRFRQSFANVRCVIIDEISMIGSDILHTINQRLQQITGQLGQPFGGLNMIFCGDFRQLPPVNASTVYKGSRNHLESVFLWQSLDYFPLEEVMRQSDITFSKILTKIGEGDPLSYSEAQLIESRFRSEQWCNEHLPGVVRLYHQNHMVDAYNTKTINGEPIVAQDAIIGYSSNEELVTARTRLHRMSVMETAGLPYSLTLANGFPYMITSNIDVEDGLVNGSIGTLRLTEKNSVNQFHAEEPRVKAWLEFSDHRIGSMARMKSRSISTRIDGFISEDWTPIQMKTANITLTKTMRCRRTQLPLTPACAITIHKSQGGTFDSAVILYDKSHQNQLVYVALSRVKAIEGLYLMNTNNDFNFHHKLGSTAPSIREIRDEYSRLNYHRLETVTSSVRNFLSDREDNCSNLIICTINAQSLVAHHIDIANDDLIQQSDILIITETWMCSESPVEINGYELVAANHQASRTIGDDYRAAHRIAGGVAIYSKVSRSFVFKNITHNTPEDPLIQDRAIGDISLVEATVDTETKFILGALYIHPRANRTNFELFIRSMLAEYSVTTRRADSAAEINFETPMMISGDFNIDVKNDDRIANFMEREFSLSYVECPNVTTIRNTTIDLTFIRGMTASCMPYIAYFSDHRPLFNKLSLKRV